MEHRYWIPEGSSKAPVKRELNECFEKDKLGERQYKKRLVNFEARAYDTMVSIEDITPFRGSPTKLHEWRVALPGNRVGRMFFVISEGIAYFLHFFIKKSKKGVRTPPENMKIGEARAQRFRLEE